MIKLKIGFITILGLVGFSSVSFAEIASKTYVDNQNIAQTTTINTALSTKANSSDLGALATKNIVSTIDMENASVTSEKLAPSIQASLGKADTALQSADLSDYAKTADVNTSLGVKANTADVNTALATKADVATTYTKIEVDTAVGAKANTTDVNTALATKADTSSVNTALATKADVATTYTKTEVDTAVGAKANTTDVNTALATKADTSTVNTALATKADVASLGSLATAAPGACSNPTNKCVLIFDGTNYGWEVIER